MSRGLRAEWYDVDAGDERDFVTWLHGEHLPGVAAGAGIAWVGHYKIVDKPSLAVAGSIHQRRETGDLVPPGRQFVLLTCGDADSLLAPSSVAAQLDTAGFLAKRRNYREAVFIEEARIDGPAHEPVERERLAPPAMQFGNFVIESPQAERAMALYYRRHRFLQVAATRGCIGARKYVSTVGWPKHGILYEFTGMDAGESLFEARMNAAVPGLLWQGMHPLQVVIHAPHAPHAGVRIWPTRIWPT